MKRCDFFKASGGLAGLGLFSGSAKSELAASDIIVFGLGGFGSRMISRLSYDMTPLFERDHPVPTFVVLDTNQNLAFESAGKISASSLVILMAGMGGVTGTNLMPQLAEQIRRSGALIVSVVTVPENDIMSAQKLSQLENASDVVFVRKLAVPSAVSNIELCVTERARSLLDAEKWMLQCTGGLLQAVAMPTRTNIGVQEIRRFVEGADSAAYGSAYGRNGRKIGSSVKAIIDQILAEQGETESKSIQSALIVCSGLAEELRWPNVQAAKDEFCKLLGPDTPCLFGVQTNEYGGPFRVKTDVWLAFA